MTRRILFAWPPLLDCAFAFLLSRPGLVNHSHDPLLFSLVLRESVAAQPRRIIYLDVRHFLGDDHFR